MYNVASNTFGSGFQNRRSYTVTDFDIFANVIMFEQEVHRALEQVVAEHGLFIHMKSFWMSNTTQHQQTVQQRINIDAFFKSINSCHMVFMYRNFEGDSYARKLHFVSHNLKTMQVRNGTELIPSEPITFERTGDNNIMTIGTGSSNRAFVEMLKCWNQMHDPKTDTALSPGLSYMCDQYATTKSSQAADFFVNATGTVSEYLSGYVDSAAATTTTALDTLCTNIDNSAVAASVAFPADVSLSEYMAYNGFELRMSSGASGAEATQLKVVLARRSRIVLLSEVGTAAT